MTCVVAWITKDKMIMSSDTTITDAGGRIMTSGKPKFLLLKRRGNQDMLIGYAGDAKAHQALLKLNGMVPQDKTKDPYIFVSQTIAPLIQSIMRDEQLITISQEDDSEKELQSCMQIVAYRGKLFEIGCDFAVVEPGENFYAIGDGAREALSSITTTIKDKPQAGPEEIISQSLKAAEQYCCSVRGPFKTIEVAIEKPITKEKKKAKPKEKIVEKSTKKKKRGGKK